MRYQTLCRWRPYAVVGNLILGAFLTTPEVRTQLLMALFLQAIYESVVWTIWRSEQKEKKAEKD
jgi:sec-independent protein translocase protein TatC